MPIVAANPLRTVSPLDSFLLPSCPDSVIIFQDPRCLFPLQHSLCSLRDPANPVRAPTFHPWFREGFSLSLSLPFFPFPPNSCSTIISGSNFWNTWKVGGSITKDEVDWVSCWMLIIVGGWTRVVVCFVSGASYLRVARCESLEVTGCNWFLGRKL